MLNERYVQLLYMTMITFKTALMADITITNEKPGAIVRGTENYSLSLECLLDGENTNKTMIWKQNDKILEAERNGNVMYSFVPMKKDHLSKFHCVVHDVNNKNTIEKVITLDIKYKPVLKFNYPDESYFVKGQTNILCCSSDSRPSTKTMMLLKDKTVITEAHHNNKICLTILHKCDFDGGKYSCFAENEVGMVKQEINITISCPPVFLEENKIVQFGKLGENITLKVVVHTVSRIKCCYIEGENSSERRHDIVIPKNTTHLYHGTDITTKELEITFSFIELHTSDYQKYKITVCNHDGNSSCIVELKPMKTEFEIPNALGSDVILLSILTTILLVAGMVFALVKRLKNKRIQTPEDVVEAGEDSTEAVENVLYQSYASRYAETTHRGTMSDNAAGSTSQRSNATNEESKRPQRLSNRFQESTRQLNYVDITFKPTTPGNEMRIRGLGNKTLYADVDLATDQTGFLEPLNELNSDDEDFVEIEDLEIFSNRKNEIDSV